MESFLLQSVVIRAISAAVAAMSSDDHSVLYVSSSTFLLLRDKDVNVNDDETGTVFKTSITQDVNYYN